ncbi:MAG: GNAT family N-acetyltransferase [Lachnospiraceae bacterium]|nr:GNAT family N-acetyltransferase [Candidatus Merdinaster equi]
MTNFVKLDASDTAAVSEMSQIASEIVKDYYDPIIGKEQNDYMLKMFQSEEAIKGQLEHGYNYYFVRNEGENLGFMAFYPRADVMYISKLYLYKSNRGLGYGKQMLQFVVDEANKSGLSAIELNVNRGNPTCEIYEHIGFVVDRLEKNDIGNGFYMDDYVCRLDLKTKLPVDKH